MRRLRLGTAGFAVGLLLVVPSAASAGMGDVVDVILGLTGPQMVGIPIACEVILDAEKPKACYIAGFPVPWPKPGEDDRFWGRRNAWVSFGGGVYTSTGKDSDMRQFESYDVWMLALEPTLNYRTIGRDVERTNNKFTLDHGVGPSLMFFFGNGIEGRDFDTFANGGIKVRPAAITWRNIRRGIDLGVAYNLRIFPKAFTAEKFGGDPADDDHEGREFAHGLSFSVSF